ncbi:MAG: circadian clock protein KaiA [Limnothrix sp.]
MLSKLFLYTIGFSDAQREEISSQLGDEQYQFQHLDCGSKSVDFLQKNREKIDCLIFSCIDQLSTYFSQLSQLGILLPTIICLENLPAERVTENNCSYHAAEQYLSLDQWETLNKTIERAIAQFLHLKPSCALSEKPQIDEATKQADDNRQAFLLLQQRRLADKLRERLGYLGIYYKRSPQYFYRNLSTEEQTDFKKQFLIDYREIVLSYFDGGPPTNQVVDEFVNQAFFADISVSYILETHMKLMDEFAQQLKLEGRSEDILLDYRLTLIDIIAHLCEMYRRSIPREDLPSELLFQID